MGLKKVLLLYNPNAGNGILNNNLDKVISAFQRAGRLVVPLRADNRSMLEKVLSEADAASYSQIIAAGGDGTVNALVNSMVKHDIEAPLAIFPSGTANDLAYYFDLPQNIDKMIEIALGEHYTYMDVGVANNKCFVNVLAMGMMVDVSQKTDPIAKNTMGIMAYYLRGMAEITKLKPIPVKLTMPEDVVETKMYAMLIMNGRSAGGFKRVAPTAAINDGLLDVIVFREMPIVNLAPLLLSVLTGDHIENEKVICLRTNRIMIESSMDIATDMDGEKGESLPINVSILPKRLKVCTLSDDMEGNVW